MPVSIFNEIGANQLHRTVVSDFERALFRSSGGGTTDVEGSHRQLSSGLTDTLRRDDSDRFTDVHQVTTSQIAAIAKNANTDFGGGR